MASIVHQSPLPSLEIPEQALTPFTMANAAQLGDKPALIDGPTGRTLTYSQLDQGIRALAGGLVARGFGKGDVLAFTLRRGDRHLYKALTR